MSSSQLSSIEQEEIQQKIIEYSKFVQDVLRPELNQVESLKLKIEKDIQDYKELQIQLTKEINTKKQNQQQQQQQQTELVDLGYQTIYCNAEFDNPEIIFIHIGMGFHIEVTIIEAIPIIMKRIKFLTNNVLQNHIEKMKQIQTHIESATMILHQLEREMSSSMKIK